MGEVARGFAEGPEGAGNSSSAAGATAALEAGVAATGRAEEASETETAVDTETALEAGLLQNALQQVESMRLHCENMREQFESMREILHLPHYTGKAGCAGVVS